MAYTPKGRLKYSDYADKLSFKEGSSKVSTEGLLQKAAKNYLQSLPDEFKYTIPQLMVKLNPGWLKPNHLRSLHKAFDDIQEGKRIKFLVSVPPRFSKTESILTGIARYMVTHQNKEVFYLSYAQDFAETKSSLVRKYVNELGVSTVKDKNSLATWQLTNGCTFHCAGLAGGQITGKGADLLVIDDAHKDRADVESATKRDRVFSSVTSDVFTRLSPEASIIICGTRWHPEDLIGRLLKNDAIVFEYLSLPAFKPDGESLWPERWSKERLTEQKILMDNDYEWDSLYMCNPRPRGSSLFGEPQYYNGLPANLRIGVGYDCAYTEKSHADHSVAIVMGTNGINFYVLDVIRKQITADKFKNELWKLRTQYPKAPFVSYMSGPEKGVFNLFNETGLRLTYFPANTDKYLRAQSVSTAWNNGRVLLPESAPWLNTFVSELVHFTGVGGGKDDQVDALAGAYAGLSSRPVRRDLRNLFPV